MDISDQTSHTVALMTEYPGISGYLDRVSPIYSNRHRTQTLYTDDIYVRKYIPNEPGHGSWGAEEVLYI
jgi:hypothetical protein